MMTDRAVKGCPGAAVVPWPPFAATHTPDAKSAALPDTVCLNVVVGVKFTVTWPLVGFCTSIDEADTAATVPTAPGRSPGGVLLDGVRVVGGVDAELPPPHAAAARASAAKPTTGHPILADLDPDI
jgi:hypothetical protein